MDIQNTSEQEAGRNSLLAQITMCSHGHPEQGEQEAGEEFSASSGNYVFT